MTRKARGSCSINFASKFKYIGGLVEGKAMVKLDNGKYAFIDHDGNVVSKEYEDAWPYYAEGKARVRLDNGKYAFIDHDGNVVSKEYEDALPYAEGKARVRLDNGKYAFIDHDGMSFQRSTKTHGHTPKAKLAFGSITASTPS